MSYDLPSSFDNWKLDTPPRFDDPPEEREETNVYVIRFSDGDYYQHRGGYDWGRSQYATQASHFDDESEAVAEATVMLPEGTNYEVVPDPNVED